MAWKGYRSRLCKCNDFNVYGVFGRDWQLECPSRDWLRSLASRDTAQRRVSHPGTSQVTLATNHSREEARQMRIGNRGLKTRAPSCERNFSTAFPTTFH